MSAIVCLSIILILLVSYGIWMIRQLTTQETKYPYFCSQPATAKKNECSYLCTDGRCLMPYEGCNLQSKEKLL